MISPIDRWMTGCGNDATEASTEGATNVATDFGSSAERAST
uniref:Uncharacterized protein n=1 Tax=uncultured bacterium A1Q1_fos_600 TaxID=1256587 RepID=L7VV28_9BACT|nr:hypothetical protein [uncultured bacterium A1Q1_fos_600]